MGNRFLEELKDESGRWVSEGIITEEQRGKLLGLYLVEQPVSGDKLKESITRWILILSAFLIALGIFSFIAVNWRNLPFYAKYGIIVAGMLVSYVWGYVLRKTEKSRGTGGALIFLGCLIFGAGIFLTGQHYHTPAYNWPCGFILWLLGTIALGCATGIFSLFYLAILLAVIPVFIFPFLVFDEKIGSEFFLTPFWLTVLTTFILFLTGYRIYKKGKKEGTE